jgi:FKBP-type peptidyl-prolyl cis-trans isomerase
MAEFENKRSDGYKLIEGTTPFSLTPKFPKSLNFSMPADNKMMSAEMQAAIEKMMSAEMQVAIEKMTAAMKAQEEEEKKECKAEEEWKRLEAEEKAKEAARAKKEAEDRKKAEERKAAGNAAEATRTCLSSDL